MNQQIVDMDMFEKRSTLTQLRDLNLDDMFMKYGFKLNYDLVQDLSCESTEVFQPGPSGGSVLEKKWIFYPMAFAFPGHPLDRNVDAVLMRYPSSIEPLAREGVEASVFLTTSEYSRTIQGSQFVDLAEYLENPPPPALFNKGPKITGLLLEGTFESLFAGREVPLDSAAPNPPTAKFGARSGLPGKVAILSDGSFMLGKTFRGKRGYLPYDNKALLMNVTDYLAGDEALTGIRSKEVVIRRLDGEKVRDNAGWIRWMNLVLPVVAVVVFGVGRGIWRRRRWE
jgi:ABC-2 type transport system permease protein